ncbi:MAG: hypothetical protein LBJ25_03880 [Candidatus Margulisbacteria bacterium]|jgi:hypothetical protein|nr:hypothetical protein [Candidatus Margulisiibacteriota bacterium]
MIKKIDKARRTSIIKNFQALAVLGCLLLPLGSKKALSAAGAASASQNKTNVAIWG